MVSKQGCTIVCSFRYLLSRTSTHYDYLISHGFRHTRLCALPFFCLRCLYRGSAIPLGVHFSVCSELLSLLGQDFAIKVDWVLTLWQTGKILAKEAIHELLRSRARGALQAMEVVQTTTQKEDMANQRAEILRVQQMLMKTLGAFRPHSRVEHFMQQFDAAKYGVKHRFKSLGLFGGSQTGKSSKALSLFGIEATLKVSCQGLGTGVIPSIAGLDRKVHRAILWDEIRPDQVLGAKEVFQSAPWVVSLGQSNCNQFAYEVWLYGIAHILCSNKFPMTEAEGQSKEDADWLTTNIVDVILPTGQTWFFGKAAGSDS